MDRLTSIFKHLMSDGFILQNCVDDPFLDDHIQIMNLFQ
jgi:hypothetical protein